MRFLPPFIAVVFVASLLFASRPTRAQETPKEPASLPAPATNVQNSGKTPESPTQPAESPTAPAKQEPAPPAPVPPGFVYPLAVATRGDGVVYVADRNMPGIWKIENGMKSIFFLGSRRFRTPMNAIRCLAFDHQGKLLVGDSSTREVYRFDDEGKPHPLTHGWIGIPMAIAVAPDGTIFTADLELHRIWKMPAEGSKEPAEFAVINSPRGLTLDPDGNLWVLSTSSKNGQIQKVSPDGKIEPFIKTHPFNLPHNIVRMDDGSFFVTDNYDHCVWKVTPDGQKEQWVAGSPLDRPVGLCRSGTDLLIADPHIRTIFKLAPDKMLTVLASSPVDPKPALQPTITVPPKGNSESSAEQKKK